MASHVWPRNALLFIFLTLIPLTLCDDDDNIPGLKGTPALRTNAHIAHGVTMSFAIVIFYPIGGILLRFFQIGDEKRERRSGVQCASEKRTMSRAVMIHVWWQSVGFVVMLVGFGLGCWLSYVHDELWNKLHERLGTVLFTLFLIQPLFGFVHHRQWLSDETHGFVKRLCIHKWLGRILIMLGIINGGLGIKLAADVDNVKDSLDVYIILAAGVVIVWGTIAGWRVVEKKRALARRVW